MPNLTPYATLTLVPFAKGTTVPITQQINTISDLSVTRGSFGAIGSASLTTDLKGIANDVVFADQLSVDARRGNINTSIYGLASKTGKGTSGYFQTPWFRGLYDMGTVHMESDEFEMTFRDYGAGLQERSIVPSTSTPNITIAAFVQNIITSSGLKYIYIDPAGGHLVGTYFNNEHVFTKTKQTAWGVLTKLAKDTGNVCYFNAEGLFYFGPRSTAISLSTLRRAFVFAQTHGISDLHTLTIVHQPYKHAAFIMQVSSHDRSQGQSTRQVARWLNSDLAKDLGTVSSLTVGGTAASLIAGTNGLPVYEISVEGKQQDEVRSQVIAEAQVIRGQEVVLKGSILGTEFINVGDPITVTGTGFSFVDSQPFVVVHVTNKFSMSEGMMTDFTAWAEVPGVQ